jgi:hypothetical protein
MRSRAKRSIDRMIVIEAMEEAIQKSARAVTAPKTTSAPRSIRAAAT